MTILPQFPESRCRLHAAGAAMFFAFGVGLATGAIAQALSMPIAFGAFALALTTTAAVTGVSAVLSRAAVSPRKV